MASRSASDTSLIVSIRSTVPATAAAVAVVVTASTGDGDGGGAVAVAAAAVLPTRDSAGSAAVACCGYGGPAGWGTATALGRGETFGGFAGPATVVGAPFGLGGIGGVTSAAAYALTASSGSRGSRIGRSTIFSMNRQPMSPRLA